MVLSKYLISFNDLSKYLKHFFVIYIYQVDYFEWSITFFLFFLFFFFLFLWGAWSITFGETLDSTYSCSFCVCLFVSLFFACRCFWLFNLFTVHFSSTRATHKYHFLVTFSLKMDLTILLTHLKIILLQYF